MPENNEPSSVNSFISNSVNTNNPNSETTPSAAKSRKKWPWILVVCVIVALIAAALVWFLVLNKTSPQQIYQQALEDAIVTNPNDQAYGSVELNSGQTHLNGQFKGNLAGSKGQFDFNLVVGAKSDNIPLTINLDMKGIDDGKNTTTYMRYNSVSSSDSKYNEPFKNYFAPVVGKWVKSTDKDTPDQQDSFEKDGPLDAVDVAGFFIPLASMSQNDKQTYLAAVKKYDLFHVGQKVTDDRFQGLEARVLKVTINKDSYRQFDNEMASSLSKKADYQKSSEQFLDDLFGNSNSFTATVYLDKNKNEFMGIKYNVNFAKPITESTFNSTMKSIDTSLLIEKNHKFSVQLPTQYISESKYQSLLGT